MGKTQSQLEANRRYMAEYRKRPGMKEKNAQYHKAYAKKHPDKIKETARRKVLKDYSLTPEQYDAMLKEQCGRCAICCTEKPGGKGRFHVDHDHATGKVRGLLCSSCNRGLGYLKDDEKILYCAWYYIMTSGRVNLPVKSDAPCS
jgi:hypothetical protein